MLGAFAEKIIDNLIESSIITYEEREVYAYGLNQGIFIIINLLTFSLISLFTKMVWESLLFMISYIPLRTYAGGYHARTQTKCYFLSILMILSVLLAIKTVSWTSPTTIGITILSGTIIFILAPMEDSNKPLSYSQLREYKKVSRIILMFELIAISALLKLDFLYATLPIISSIATVSIMIVLGKGDGNINNHKDYDICSKKTKSN